MKEHAVAPGDTEQVIGELRQVRRPDVAAEESPGVHAGFVPAVVSPRQLAREEPRPADAGDRPEGPLIPALAALDDSLARHVSNEILTRTRARGAPGASPPGPRPRRRAPEGSAP